MRFLSRLLIKSFLKWPRVYATYYGLRIEKLVNVHRIMEYLDWLNQNSTLPIGDYCEFGVGSGNSMISAYFISTMYKNLTSMRFIGFDSFQGLPETNNKYDRHAGWKTGDINFSIAAVEKNFKKAKIPLDKYILIPGFFEESLNENIVRQHNVKKVAYVHIDCDYYTSTKTALNFIKPYLIEGAIIGFDDYYCYSTPLQGEPKAFSEWLEENPDVKIRIFSRYSTFGKTFTVYFNEK